MGDLNFFSGSIELEKTQRRKRSIILICILIYIGIVGGMYYMLTKDAGEIEDNIVSLREYANSTEFSTKLMEIKAQKNEYDVLRNYHDAVKAILADFENSGFISTDLLDEINATIPQGIILNNMMFSPGLVVISGEASSRTEVAEFYKNLKDTGIFSDITLGTVNENEDIEEEIVVDISYSFDMQCTTKGGKTS